MKKTFTGFVVVATIAGSLTATPASAQRGVAASARYWPAPYGAVPGPYDDFGSCEWVTQRFWDGWLAGSPGAGLRLTACEIVRQT